jgi:hypothetical protein
MSPQGQRISQARNWRKAGSKQSFEQTIQRYIPADGAHHKHHCENNTCMSLIVLQIYMIFFLK